MMAWLRQPYGVDEKFVVATELISIQTDAYLEVIAAPMCVFKLSKLSELMRILLIKTENKESAELYPKNITLSSKRAIFVLFRVDLYPSNEVIERPGFRPAGHDRAHQCIIDISWTHYLR